MAFRDIWRSISQWLGRKPPPKPLDLHGEAMMGHRGVAMGRATKPDLSPENVAKWQRIEAPELEDFLNSWPILVRSSNVGSMVQYFPETEQMIIEYLPHGRHPLRAYLYQNIAPFEALLFAKAFSKGTWVWDHLRIRGTGKGHKKPYVRIR